MAPDEHTLRLGPPRCSGTAAKCRRTAHEQSRMAAGLHATTNRAPKTSGTRSASRRRRCRPRLSLSRSNGLKPQADAPLGGFPGAQPGCPAGRRPSPPAWRESSVPAPPRRSSLERGASPAERTRLGSEYLQHAALTNTVTYLCRSRPFWDQARRGVLVEDPVRERHSPGVLCWASLQGQLSWDPRGSKWDPHLQGGGGRPNASGFGSRCPKWDKHQRH